MQVKSAAKNHKEKADYSSRCSVIVKGIIRRHIGGSIEPSKKFNFSRCLSCAIDKNKCKHHKAILAANVSEQCKAKEFEKKIPEKEAQCQNCVQRYNRLRDMILADCQDLDERENMILTVKDFLRHFDQCLFNTVHHREHYVNSGSPCYILRDVKFQGISEIREALEFEQRKIIVLKIFKGIEPKLKYIESNFNRGKEWVDVCQQALDELQNKIKVLRELRFYILVEYFENIISRIESYTKIVNSAKPIINHIREAKKEEKCLNYNLN